MILGAALLAAACGPRPSAQVEKVELCSVVGDYGLEADAIEITVSNPRSLKGLKAEDFDLVNNVPAAFIDAATGQAPTEYEDDGIVLTVNKNVLRIEAKPFNKAGKSEGWFKRIPWELHCAVDSALNVTAAQVTGEHIAVLDDCETGTFTFGGLTREYMLHLPKDANGKVIPNAPLLVWQIGGGEYDKDLMTVATANRCLVSLPTEGVPCATLVFALANPNYSYSASLFPEKIELIDRNNALQMAFIDQLIAEGKVDGSKLFCAGASSGGGCTMRFMMQFADRFKAAIPCCAMDPIVPIHQESLARRLRLQVERHRHGARADGHQRLREAPDVLRPCRDRPHLQGREHLRLHRGPQASGRHRRQDAHLQRRRPRPLGRRPDDGPLLLGPPPG